MPVRVEPTLQFSVLCEGIGHDSKTDTTILIGLVDQIDDPSRFRQFYIVNKWTNGQGEFREELRILSPTLDPTDGYADNQFVLESRTGRWVSVTGFVNFVFLTSGVYWVQVTLDSQLVAAYPLPVLRASQGSSVE